MKLLKQSVLILIALTLLVPLFSVISASGWSHGLGRQIDPELEPFVVSFDEYMGTSSDYLMYMDVLPPGVAGVCIQAGVLMRPVVVVNIIPVLFLRGDTAHRYLHQLMWHELGHCTLNLDHYHAYHPDGSPMSIMHEYAFGHYPEYQRYLEDYKLQLKMMRQSNSSSKNFYRSKTLRIHVLRVLNH